MIVLIANAHHLAAVQRRKRPGYLLQPDPLNDAIDVFDRPALLELRRAARLQSILRPASRDQIRDRAVRQRPSGHPPEASEDANNKRPRATSFLPTSNPSPVSGRLDPRKVHRERARTSGPKPRHLEASRSIFSSRFLQNRHKRVSRRANFYFFRRISRLARHQMRFGGAERDRTADPLLAKQVLSQLSYSPNHRNTRQTKPPGSGKPVNRHLQMQMVGPGRLELPTPRLSSVCSNQLSYGPTSRQTLKLAIRHPYRTLVRRRPSGALAERQHIADMRYGA